MSDKARIAKEALRKYTNKDFSDLVPDKYLNIGRDERLTVEFAFWFCHFVEQSLAKMITDVIAGTESPDRNSDHEVWEYIRIALKVEREKLDQGHPDHKPMSVSFGDRIYFIELVLGRNSYVNFLWKLKNLRDAISHGRTSDLTYEGELLSLPGTKANLMSDFIDLSLRVKEEEPVNALRAMTPEKRMEIEEKWRKYKEENVN